MSTIANLKIGLGFDLTSLSRQGEEVNRAVRSSLGQVEVAPKVGEAEGQGAEALAARLAAAGETLAARLRAGLSGAGMGLGPAVARQLATLAPMADRTSGAIITALRRIDEEISLPRVHETLDKLASKLVSISAVGLFRAGKTEAERKFDAAVKAAGPLGPILGMVATDIRKVATLFESLAVPIRAIGQEARANVPILREMSAAAGAGAAPDVGGLKGQLKALWDRGPVARFWRDFEERGKEALAKVRFRESVPRRRGTIGEGERITPEGSRVTKQDRRTAEIYELMVRQSGDARKAVLGLRLAFQAVGAVSKGALVIANDHLRALATPVLIPVAGLIRLRMAVTNLNIPMTRVRDVASRTYTALFGGARQAAAGVDDATRSVGLFQRSLRAATLPVRALGSTITLPFRAGTAAAKATTASVATLAGGFRGLGVQVAAAFGVFGLIYKGVQFLKDGVMEASRLNEAVSYSKQVFRESFGVVEGTVSRLEKDFGILRRSQIEAANAFGGIAKGAGATEAQAAQLSATLVQFAADLSSARDLSFEVAADKLRSGLSGQSEPLLSLGALITKTAVEAKALSMGLGEVARSGKKKKTVLSELDMVTARAALITEKLADADGDLERTAGAAANQFRKAGGGVSAFGAQIGGLLLPAVQAATEGFNDLLATVLDTFEENRATLESWGQSLAGFFGGFGSLVRNWESYWTIAKLSATQSILNVVAAVETLPANFAIVTGYLGRNWYELFADLGGVASAAFTNLLADAASFGRALWDAIQGKGFNFTFKPLLDGFEATAEKFPELARPAWVDMSEEMAAEFRKIGDREAARAARIAQAAAPRPAEKAAAEEEPAKKDDNKLASAVDATSREAYSAVAKALAGRDGAREGVRLQREGNATQKQILAELKKRPAGQAAAVVGF